MIRLFAMITLCALPVYAMAQTPTPSTSGKPLEITAQKTLEWDREAKMYKATGGATARQGDFAVKSDDMLARYEQDQSELTTIEADGNVELSSQGRVATGDKGIYDMRTGLATLTGSDLKITSPDLLVTAKESLNYNTNAREFTAKGKASAVQTQENRTINGDVLTANFTDANELSAMKATGNVSILAGEDKVSGDRADYNALKKTAEVTGKEVILTRGPNVLKGDRATVDLNTNISKLFGNETKPATAVFYPKSSKSDTVTP